MSCVATDLRRLAHFVVGVGAQRAVVVRPGAQRAHQLLHVGLLHQLAQLLQGLEKIQSLYKEVLHHRKSYLRNEGETRLLNFICQHTGWTLDMRKYILNFNC